MADDNCTHMLELDDIHRWLPSDVLRDIGIADTAERRRLTVIDDLAARLVGVLGEMTTTHCSYSSFHQPVQVIRGHHALAGVGHPRAAAAPPP
uniref:Uncharacterized protein n=1 Tax=Leersia perrieri TaxID=77586 RepID=A0A0D9VU26_9ORYZ